MVSLVLVARGGRVGHGYSRELGFVKFVCAAREVGMTMGYAENLSQICLLFKQCPENGKRPWKFQAGQLRRTKPCKNPMVCTYMGMREAEGGHKMIVRPTQMTLPSTVLTISASYDVVTRTNIHAARVLSVLSFLLVDCLSYSELRCKEPTLVLSAKLSWSAICASLQCENKT